MSSRRRVVSSLAVVLASLAPGLAAQLVSPADGQLPFLGSAWHGTGSAESLAVDLNADGYADVAMGSFDLRTALNNGHGVLKEVGDVTNLPLVYDIAAGDLDGDGRVDLATCTSSAAMVTTLLGDGTGRLQLAGSFPSAAAASLVLADLNLDGQLDVVAGQNATGFAFSSQAGLGDGTLAAPFPVGTTGFSETVDAGDWDGDGDQDVLTGAVTGQHVYLADGAGHFQPGPSASFSVSDHGAAFADVDADGLLDVVNTYTPVSGAQVLYHHHVGSGFAQPLSISAPFANELAVERAPQDGFANVVVGNGAGLNLLTNASGILAVQPGVFVAAKVEDLSFGDFDGDGLSDVLASSSIANGVVILFATPPGGLPIGKHLALPSGTGYVGAFAMADLDGNGRQDLVACDRDVARLDVALGQATPALFGAWSTQPTTFGAIDLKLLDATGDGALDAVSFNAQNPSQFSVHVGDGAGHFGPVLSSPSGGIGYACAAGDVDEDGNTDLAHIAGPQNGPNLRSAIGSGSGFFITLATQKLSADAVGLELADVDVDGHLDAIVVRSGPGAPADGELLVAHGNGTGAFGVPVAVPQSVGLLGAVVAGDFSEDGIPDLAVTCSKGGSVALFAADGAGGFRAPAVDGFSDDDRALLAADVDDDGALDLVLSSFFEAAVVLVRGDGHGGLHAATGHPGSRSGGTRPLAAGDVDLDGRTDLVQLGTADDDVAILLRQTGGENAWASIGGGIPAAAGQSIAVGSGEPLPGQLVVLDVAHAAPAAPSFLVLGSALLDQPFKGGHLVPVPDLVVAVGTPNAQGQLHLANIWPAPVPTGTEFWLQVFVADASAVHGLAATGGLRLRAP